MICRPSDDRIIDGWCLGVQEKLSCVAGKENWKRNSLAELFIDLSSGW
jgi:hypothetical protein